MIPPADFRRPSGSKVGQTPRRLPALGSDSSAPSERAKAAELPPALSAPAFASAIWLLAALLQFTSIAVGAAVPPEIVRHEDLGSLPLKTNLVHAIAWRNAGTNAVTILRVQPTCECLDVIGFPTSIPAGQEGVITVRLHTSAPGRVDFAVLAEVAGDPVEKVFLLSALVAEGRPRPTPDHRLLVRPRELIDRGLGASVLVDVRVPGKYAEAHIPGSLNLPLHQVKTKDFLKAREVILVSEGYELERLLEESQLLLERQFASVKILEGGIRSWQQAGGSVNGNRAGQIDLGNLSATEYDRSRYEPGWLVIWLVPPAEAAHERLFHDSRTVPLDLPASQFLATVRQEIEAKKDVTRVLFLTERGQGYDPLKEVMAQAPLPPTFFLSGGAESYHAHVLDQIARQGRRQVTLTGRSVPSLATVGLGLGTTAAGCGCGARH